MRHYHLRLPAHDLPASMTFYRNLGFKQVGESPPGYAKYLSPEGDVTLSLERVETVAELPNTILFVECQDLDMRVSELRTKGLVFESTPDDERWGWREAYLKDPRGNSVCLFNSGRERTTPPER